MHSATRSQACMRRSGNSPARGQCAENTNDNPILTPAISSCPRHAIPAFAPRYPATRRDLLGRAMRSLAGGSGRESASVWPILPAPNQKFTNSCRDGPEEMRSFFVAARPKLPSIATCKYSRSVGGCHSSSDLEVKTARMNVYRDRTRRSPGSRAQAVSRQ